MYGVYGIYVLKIIVQNRPPDPPHATNPIFPVFSIASQFDSVAPVLGYLGEGILKETWETSGNIWVRASGRMHPREGI